MTIPRHQTEYWDRAASSKTFGHPVCFVASWKPISCSTESVASVIIGNAQASGEFVR